MSQENEVLKLISKFIKDIDPYIDDSFDGFCIHFDRGNKNDKVIFTIQIEPLEKNELNKDLN